MFLLEPVGEHGFQDAELRIGNVLLVERPEKEGVLVLHFQAEHGGFVEQRLATGAGRGEERGPPFAILRLELRIELQRGEGVLLAIVALQPGGAGLGFEPEREVNRKVRVDALSLHRFDDFETVPHLGRVHLAVLVEVAAVEADQVDTMLG